MPARQLPSSFKATKDLDLNGTMVAQGATVTARVAATQLGQRLGEYVSRGWLVPDKPLYPQTAHRVGTKKVSQEYSLNPSEIRILKAS